jgi:hypothetical protein
VPPNAQTGILVRTRIFPLAWILLLVKTTVTVDGVPHALPWGENFFPVTPGQHQVGANQQATVGQLLAEHHEGICWFGDFSPQLGVEDIEGEHRDTRRDGDVGLGREKMIRLGGSRLPHAAHGNTRAPSLAE